MQRAPGIEHVFSVIVFFLISHSQNYLFGSRGNILFSTSRTKPVNERASVLKLNIMCICDIR